MADVVERLKNALEAEYVVLGGGNAKNIKKLPSQTLDLGDNRNAFVGGFRLWKSKTLDRVMRKRAAGEERKCLMAASRSDVLVIFGVTGDLAHKMIFPALYAMVKRGSGKVGGNRCCPPKLESGAFAQARDGQHKAIGGDR